MATTKKTTTKKTAKKVPKKATKKTAAKKATKKKAVKAVDAEAPAKKIRLKKPVDGAATPSPFRPDSVKGRAYQKFLADGQPASVAEMRKFFEEHDRTPALVSTVLADIRRKGGKVIRDREAGTVRIEW